MTKFLGLFKIEMEERGDNYSQEFLDFDVRKLNQLGNLLTRRVSNINWRKSLNKLSVIHSRMKEMNDQSLKWFDKVNSDLKENDKFVCILLDIL